MTDAPYFYLSDPTLFGNEAAEDEQNEVFNSYFVQRKEFKAFRDSANRLCIANGYKGEGKSALLRATETNLRSKSDNAVIVSLRSTDLLLGVPTGYDEWVRIWKVQIANSIAAEIGKSIGVAWTADDIAAVEAAERGGFREKNLVGVIMERFSVSFGNSVSINPRREMQSFTDQELKRLSESRQIWVFLDDSDLNFQDTSEGRFKVAGLFTAARHLCNSVENLRFRTTIRPTTWSILYRNIEDMSHVQQYLISMEWQIQDLRNILARRVEAYLTRKEQHLAAGDARDRATREEFYISMLFGNNWPWGKNSAGQPLLKDPHVVLGTLCRLRPRWLIELCRESALVAFNREGNSITFSDVERCLVAFGNKRLQNTVGEFSVECQKIETILTAFDKQPERYRTDELLKIIKNRITEGNDIRIAGEVGRCGPQQVAKFLFRIGFLTARMDYPGGYDHFSYAEKPHLMADNSNLDHGHSWEIHPIFRQALNLRNVTGQAQKGHRTGGGREAR